MSSREIHRIITARRALSVRDHPHLRGSLQRMSAAGVVTRVLPGTYVAADGAADLTTRCCAIAAWRPDAVITGDAAAALTFWAGRPVRLIEVATRRREHHRGFEIVGRRVDPELILSRGPLRISVPALTALDLADRTDGDSIDQFLRVRAGGLPDLQQALALNPGRRGNQSRRRLLFESRAEPWSAAERLGHQLLRSAGINGWVANQEIILEGSTYYLDISFRSVKVVVEIDGSHHWTDQETAIEDRRRQNVLVLNGWLVLRFTWWDLVDHPGTVIAQVGRALRARTVAR